MAIHPSAIIDATAEIGANVEIGPFCYVGAHCKIGEGSKLLSNVVLQEYVTLGKNCQIASGAVLGGLPQDHAFKGEVSYVVVGDDTVIRECVTINRASGEGKTTTVGKKCMLMAYVHLAHNCDVRDEVIIANATQLAGYVQIDDFAFVSSNCIVHQFVRIGKLAMIGGGSGLRQDVPPFALGFGIPMELIGINKIGLKRRGYDLNTRTLINRAYKALFFASVNVTQGMEALKAPGEFESPVVQELLSFVQSSKRGIRKPRKKQSADGTDPSESMMAEML